MLFFHLNFQAFTVFKNGSLLTLQEVSKHRTFTVPYLLYYPPVLVDECTLTVFCTWGFYFRSGNVGVPASSVFVLIYEGRKIGFASL